MAYFLVRIYWKVRQDERRSAQWRFETQHSESANWRSSTSAIKDRASRTMALDENLKKLNELEASRPAQSERLNLVAPQRSGSGDALSTDGCVEQHPTKMSTRQHDDRRSRKRRRGQQRTELEKNVFWQCLSYFAAFMLVWPFPIAFGYIQAITYTESIRMLLIIAFVTPLQGFANALVYFRPQLKKSKLCRWRAGGSKNSHTPGTSSTQNLNNNTGRHKGSSTNPNRVGEGQYIGGNDCHDVSMLDSQMAEWEPSMVVDDTADTGGDHDYGHKVGAGDICDPSIAMLELNREREASMSDDDDRDSEEFGVAFRPTAFRP